MELLDARTVVSSIASLGSAGVFAAAIYWLLLTSLNAFREELCEERKLHRELSANERQVCREGYELLAKTHAAVGERVASIHQEVLILKERVK